LYVGVLVLILKSAIIIEVSRRERMTLHISQKVEQQLNALAEGAGREPDALATELLDAAVQRYNRKLAKLREAVDAGDASADAPGGSFNRVRARLGLPAR
jgi:hypothetical protein